MLFGKPLIETVQLFACDDTYEDCYLQSMHQNLLSLLYFGCKLTGHWRHHKARHHSLTMQDMDSCSTVHMQGYMIAINM